MRWILLFVFLLAVMNPDAFAVEISTTTPPMANHLINVSVAFGDVTASYVEAVDMVLPVVYDHISVESSLDGDILIRLGESGGPEIIARGGTSMDLCFSKKA